MSRQMLVVVALMAVLALAPASAATFYSFDFTNQTSTGLSHSTLSSTNGSGVTWIAAVGETMDPNTGRYYLGTVDVLGGPTFPELCTAAGLAAGKTCVDLAGTGQPNGTIVPTNVLPTAGRIVTSQTFAFQPGTTYAIVISIAGSQRPPTGTKVSELVDVGLTQNPTTTIGSNYTAPSDVPLTFVNLTINGANAATNTGSNVSEMSSGLIDGASPFKDYIFYFQVTTPITAQFFIDNTKMDGNTGLYGTTTNAVNGYYGALLGAPGSLPDPAVPEPGTSLMAGAGLVAAWWLLRRRRRSTR